MNEINPPLSRFREIRNSERRPDEVLFEVTEREIIALMEQNIALAKENEKLKVYADINWLKREMDALTDRVAHLEMVGRLYPK